MGAEEARLFAIEGACVAICDILEKEGRNVETQINDLGGRAIFIRMNVAHLSDWRRAATYTVNQFGRLDILVNNAGIGRQGNIEDTTEKEWDEVMAINAKGMFLGAKTVIPEMRKVGGGSIINIASQMGIVGSDTGSIAYHASKGAVRAFTKSAALWHAKEGIRVNSVHPGPIATPMNRERLSNFSEMDWSVSRVPLGRIGQTKDVAYGVLYLASDESSFITGAELVIDGGWIAQ